MKCQAFFNLPAYIRVLATIGRTKGLIVAIGATAISNASISVGAIESGINT